MSARASRSLNIFISYSRKDQDFADELLLGLTACGFQPYLDRHDIAPGEAWEERLRGLILSADSVVFVVSPDSVGSERCEWELDRAESHRKRLIPVVCRPVGDSHVPKRLGRLHYIFFCGEGFSFARSLADLSSSLTVDLDWIREHTRLTSLAERWKSSPSQSLRGDEVSAAKKWLDESPGNGLEPTALQRDFIEASELDERNRIATELAKEAAIKEAEAGHLAAELRAKSLRRYLVVAALAFAVAVVVFGVLHWQRQVEAKLFTARIAQLEAEADREKALTRLDASLAVSSVTPGTTNSGQVDASMESLAALISPNALELIVAMEVGGRARYEASFSKPFWPGGESGVNIGIGYDLGYTSKQELIAGWGRALDQKTLDSLLAVQGIRGSQARVLAKALEGIQVPWDAAIGVFKSNTLPKYVQLLRKAVPGVADLPPDSFGAVLSVIYNRGTGCFNSGGARCTEMQRIRDLIANKNYEEVPEQIRSMKRLYPEVKGLQVRREREAELFEAGLAGAR